MKASKGKRLKKMMIPLIIIAAAIIVYVIAAGNSVYIPTISASPSEGEAVSLLEGKVYEFASDYSKECSAGKYNHSDMYLPKSVHFDTSFTARGYICVGGEYTYFEPLSRSVNQVMRLAGRDK